MENLVKKVIVAYAIAFVALGLMFFVPAGTIYFWQAWIYLILMFFVAISISIYLFRHDKAVIERRMKLKEKEEPQKNIIRIGSIFYLVLFIIPGLDFRFGWSQVPIAVIVLSDAVFLFGYYLFFLTLKENPYAARTIEVEKGQKVITTGPYALVRHPMYSAVLLIMFVTPLCLGSYWGMLATIPMFPLIVFRILNEEKVLAENLPGYREYLEKTRYRLIPGLW